MKRILTLLLVLSLLAAFCLSGCDVDSLLTEPEDTSTSDGNTSEDIPEDAPEDEPEDEPQVEEHVHSYTEEITAATCQAGGYTTFTCQCGDTYQANETNALGHSYTSKVVPPTAGVQGYTQYSCSRCNYGYKDNYVWGADMPTTFFDDAAFIGDSVTLALRNYQASTGALGKATFLCVGSYSVNNAVTSKLYLSYQGQDMSPENALAACGAKKVFILLGMNDIALAGEKSIGIAMENWATMISRIRAKNPDIQIYIQSGTPIYTNGQKGGINNNRMNAYNESLQTFAAQNNCDYIDIATPMKDSTGGLAEKYCSDSYVHLTSAACELWVNVLKSYVRGLGGE